jgi:signal transduction histidine kinase
VISEQASERMGVLSAVRLAWFLWASAAVLVALGAVLLALNRNVEDPIAPYWLNLAATALALSTVGALIASRRPENPVGWLLVSSGLLYAVMVSVGEYGTYALLTERGSPPGGVVAAWLGSWLYVLGANLVVYSFLLFPDGRLPSPRWRTVAWLVALAICLDTASLALTPGTLYGYPSVENPFGVEWIAGRSGLLGAVTSVLALAALLPPVAALFIRFRRSRGEERQQVKWIAYGVAVLAAAIVAVNLWPALDPSAAGAVLFFVGQMAIPAAICIAIFKYHLYDIDLVINRTLVYGALTACVVGIYVLVVGYLGALLRTDGNLLVSLIATGLVAVLFQPLRERLQRGVNRLMYGERDDPYTVISRLGERLKTTDAPEAVLPTIVETVAQALKLPHAAIALKQDDGEFVTVADYGSPKGEPLVLPLSYGTETIGQLALSPRAPGEPFGAEDRRLLDSLIRHAEAAAYAVHLTADLQKSRERLVNAREEERRRLRRDLHDGLGPQLATLTLKLDATRNMLVREPEAADALLAGLKVQTQQAISDIRRLVYDLRPPALDELGLIPAIREQAASYGPYGLDVSVEAAESLPPLPAAVEVAVYRIVQEALTNVARHARARACRIRLSIGEKLELEIADDGIGLPEDRRAGVGLSSMRERAAELGGICILEPSGPAGGTRVLARLPLPASEERP